MRFFNFSYFPIMSIAVVLTQTSLHVAFANTAFTGQEYQEIRNTIQNTFNSNIAVSNMPLWCNRESTFQVGPVLPEYFLDFRPFISNDHFPREISPYLKDSGIYHVSVLVENKGSFVNMFRREEGRIVWAGSRFCDSCAEQMVKVEKSIKGRAADIEKIVYFSCFSIHKILVILKDGSEELYNSTTKEDPVPNTAEGIREYLRNYIDHQERAKPKIAKEDE